MAENRKFFAEKKREAAKKIETEVSLKWMDHFEKMHQQRMEVVEANTHLRASIVVKDREIDCLKNAVKESKKSNRDAHRLLRRQMIVMQNQQQMINRYSAINRRLRILNNNKKKLIKGLAMSFEMDRAQGKQKMEKSDEYVMK